MAKKVQKTRRANGEGLLRQRKNGSWELRVQDGVDEKGRPRRKSFYGRDPQEVYAKMAEYLEAEASGVNLDSFFRKITFQHLTKEGIKSIGHAVELMAENELLDAHKNAMSVRINKTEQ